MHICLISYKKSEKELISYLLCNPKIINAYDEFTYKNEGCLSLPNIRCDTKRFNYVFVVDDFHPQGFIVCEEEAIICQHEIDHLNGKLFTDYKVIKLGRNDLCSCNSGKKYKRCCYKGD